MVFEARSRSDAVIVGGNTVRRDNPRLTTRRDGGHAPVRIVMSRTLDLPEVRGLDIVLCERPRPVSSMFAERHLPPASTLALFLCLTHW